MLILETERLIIRKLCKDDFDNIARTLQDEKAMYAYEHAFSDDEVTVWLEKQLDRYVTDGFGLWALEDKITGIFLGQCGLTLQQVGKNTVVEIGYLLERKHWHQGYAQEAATACRDYAFSLGISNVYSIIRDNNHASIKVAEAIGMHKIGTVIKYYLGFEMPHSIYEIKIKA